MARGSNSREGRAARSEGGSSAFQGAEGQAGASFMKSQINEVGLVKSNAISRETVVAISNALNQIADKIIPTKPTTLTELYDTNGKAYDRLISVRSDEAIGNKKVAEAINLLANETDRDKRITAKGGAGYVQEGLGRGRKAVIALANDLMMRAFVQGQRNFSGFAQLSISDLTPTFGEKTAAKLVDLALREGYDRMQRAGMTWQEKDPRNQLSGGRAAKSERSASSAYNPDTQKIRMQAITETLERKDLTQEQKAIISSEIAKGFRDKKIGLG